MKRLKDESGQASVVTASFDRFLRPLLKNQGQALIEYLLVLPMVFLLLVNVVNFGGFFYAFITVANAARAGADYAIMGGASVASGHIATVSASQIATMITTEIASLPNNPSLSVNICQNNSGTITVLSGTCSSIASDPEPANYVLTSIDVTYTYQPFIPLFSFPNLHINATLPATTIHRRAVMRSLQ
jgi:Flp pilus assembly protein TadG